ncbi:MAG: hypothetical protein M3217_07825 [Actinomycetota bacterium]|nr:hypothetical protein [Actinomycetota bacterium]
MRFRWPAVAAAAAVIAVALVAPANGAPRRVHMEEFPYQTPAIGAHAELAYGWYYDCEMQVGCAIVPSAARNRWVDLEIQDATGTTVYGAVYSMPGGNHYRDFCGSTDEPIYVRKGIELLVHVIPGVCPGTTTPSTPTRGTVVATFSRG